MNKINVGKFISHSKMFFLAMVAFYSMRPYFWWDRTIVLLLLDVFVFLFFFLQHFFVGCYESRKISARDFIIADIFLLLFTWQKIVWGMEWSMFGSIGNIVLYLFPVMVMLVSDVEEKEFFLSFFTGFVALVFSISIFFFLLYLAGIYRTRTPLYHPSNEGYGQMSNFKFFILCKGETIAESIFPRFQSVLTEPGHVGMISALLLYANEYNIKRPSLLVIVTSLFLSLSGAGYALLVLGILLRLYFNSRNRVIAFVTVALAGTIIMGGLFLYYESNPNSVFSKRIITRFMFDKKRGVAGNNRNTADFLKEYDDYIKNGGIQLVIGKGPSVMMEKYSWGNSSYKCFILVNGLVGLFLLVGFYAGLVYFRQSRLAVGMLLLFSASFLQRPVAVDTNQIFIFASAVAVFHKNQGKRYER